VAAGSPRCPGGLCVFPLGEALLIPFDDTRLTVAGGRPVGLDGAERSSQLGSCAACAPPSGVRSNCRRRRCKGGPAPGSRNLLRAGLREGSTGSFRTAERKESPESGRRDAPDCALGAASSRSAEDWEGRAGAEGSAFLPSHV
jgi:hypothetical protein